MSLLKDQLCPPPFLEVNSKWPASLRTALRAVLDHRIPMPVLWGENFLQLHNDAYQSVPDAKHLHALRRLCKETWRGARTPSTR